MQKGKRNIIETTRRLLSVAAIGLLLATTGCVDFMEDERVDRKPTTATTPSLSSSTITPSYESVEPVAPKLSKGRLTTRSLVNQETTVKLQANFLRVDEGVAVSETDIYEHHRGLYTFDGGDSRYEGSVNWEESYLMEATLMSSPDNTGGRQRQVFLDPVQSYKLRVLPLLDEFGEVMQDELGNTMLDTTDYYHTRMVSWYPMNCPVMRTDDGTAVNMKFGEFYSEVGVPMSYDTNNDGTPEDIVAIQFSGLDGSMDVMVSDMREGQHWHFNRGTHRSDFYPDDASKTGPSIYKEPFGSFSQEAIPGEQEAIEYNNTFTYKHYLSAARIFAYADQSPQNLMMWGELESVVIADQPTSVKVWLPYKEGEFGEAFDWDNYQNIETIGTPIFGEGDSSGDMTETVTFPVSMENTSASDMLYLGYALVQPDRDVTIQLHTSSGIYSITVPAKYTHIVDGAEETIDVFQQGHIYDIFLNLKTSGTIAALLENESNEIYYDLTKLHTYEVPGEEEVVGVYKHANCYICSPNDTFITDKEGNFITDSDGNKMYYDGYCFSATVVGNGEGGIISYGSMNMYPTNAHIEPHSARLLWESELGLITQVELLYGYVRFKVPDRTMEGNAVIAVYDKDDNVLWSWHIWITDPPAEQTYVNGDLEIVMLDRNLGATADKWTTGDPSTALATYGLYYQWGRKDPSMGPLSYNYFPINLITAPYWDYSSMERNAAEIVQIAQPTLKDGVVNPMFLVLPSEQTQTYSYNWTHQSYDFLWGYSPDDGTMVKTIYDPCPFGYRVPLSEMGTIFSDDGGSSFSTPSTSEYGQIFTNNGTTFYFPYAGYKGVDVGLNSLVLSWSYVGEKGDYMSASVSKNTTNLYNHRSRAYISRSNSWNETNVGQYNSYRTNDYTNRRTAGSIRCVKNVPMGMLELQLIPSKESVSTNDELTITMNGFSSESHIVSAVLEVQNITTGAKKLLYQTPEGVSEGTDPKWSRSVVFTTGDEGGEFYSQLGYVFTLTCINDLGVSSTVSTTVGYHSLSIDLESKWEKAEQSEVAVVDTEFLRYIHILASETPAKVEVIYTADGAEKVVDITATGFTSTLPDEGYASNREYVAAFNISESGTYDVTVRVTCGQPDAHITTKQTTVTVCDLLETTITTSGRYFWTSDDELNPYVPVSVQYYSKSINKDIRDERPDDEPKIISQTLSHTDGTAESTFVEIPLDEGRADLSESQGSAVVYLDSNGTHNHTITYAATDAANTANSENTVVGLMELDATPFPTVATLGRECVMRLRLLGGGTPLSVTLGGLAMNLPAEGDNSDNTVYVHDGEWQLAQTFNTTGERSFNLIVTLQDEQGSSVVLPTKTLSLVVYAAPSLTLDVSPRYVWRSHLTSGNNVTAEWNASSPNGAMSSVRTTIDGTEEASLTVTGNGSSSASRSAYIDTSLQANTDGRAEISVVVTDEVGAEMDAESYVAVMDVSYAANWSNEERPNTDFSRTLTINGGEEPSKVWVGDVEFSKSSTNSSGYYSSTNWIGTFNFAEGTYATLPITLTFESGDTITYNYAPALNVVLALEDISVTITTSDEIFHGAKSGGTISATASSPNGNIVYVKITDSADNVIYEGNPAAASWSSTTLANNLTESVKGLDETLTIYARDEFGVEATTTTTADIYYTVRQTNNTFVAGGMYLFESRSSNGSYIYDAGANLGSTTTLSSDALFTLSATGTTQTLRSTNSGHYVADGTSNNSTPTCDTTRANNAAEYTIEEYGSDYFRICYDSWLSSYYWYLNNSSIRVSRSSTTQNTRQWMVYQALVD